MVERSSPDTIAALADKIDDADVMYVRNCPMFTKFDHENVDTLLSGEEQNLIVAALRASQPATPTGGELPLAVRLRDEAGPPLPQMIAQRRAVLANQQPSPSSAATASADYVMVPRELTAENGAKAFLSGEFSETFDYMDEEGDECQAEIPVSWTTIKAIHKKMVERFGVVAQRPAEPRKTLDEFKEFLTDLADLTTDEPVERALLAAREYIAEDNNPKSNRVLALIRDALEGVSITSTEGK